MVDMISNLNSILPAIIIMTTGFVVLLGDSCSKPWRDNGKTLNPTASIIGILIAAYFVFMRLNDNAATAFAGAVVDDSFSRCCNLLLLITAGLAVCISTTYLENRKLQQGEYYVLILFSLFGALLMTASNDLITLFVAIETLSVALYVLAGFARTEARSDEAALKYFLLGAFAAGFLLFGIALIYGGTAGAVGSGGTTRLDLIFAHLTRTGFPSPMFIAGLALVLVGLGFKAALVPFHMWTPDVYQGAPTSVTAYMAAGAKIAAFAVILRLFYALAPIAPYWATAAQILAVLTMFAGNILALNQDNVKRILAYSSIAHAGYLMSAVASLGGKNALVRASAVEALTFYLLSYALTTMGSFGILIWLSNRGRDCQTLNDVKGLARKEPFAAYSMLIFMLSLGGIPLTMGFWGKWLIFNTLLQANMLPVALCLAIASAISIYYYLKVVWTMCFMEPDSGTIVETAVAPGGVRIALFISLVSSILFGVAPAIIQNFMSASSNLFIK